MMTTFCMLFLMALFAGFSPKKYPVIFMIGDSTMANKDLRGGNTERGWGMVLPGFLPEEIRVENYAKNGRSSKSFMTEGLWKKVYDRITPGDYVFIQFGHNDQKKDTLRFSDPETSFKDNLKKYINQTRSKGGIPVLFTSIARRNFDAEGRMADTHGRYIGAVKEVGVETNTPVIDMNARSVALFESAGQEGSKSYFNHVAPGTQAFRPEGKVDDTHFNIKGARALAEIAIGEISTLFPDLGNRFKTYDLVVAKDGSGHFRSVQEAVDAVPDYRKVPTTIYIKKGVYKEKVVVPESKQKIRLIGENQDSTILTYDDYASRKNRFGEEMGTSGSASFYVYAPEFEASDLTFENSAGPVGQAVAILIKGDKASFYRCRFLGNQDTLYAYGQQDGSQSRQYYEACYIEGTVDFIFGWATAVFNKCTIHSVGNGYLTAASTPRSQQAGYLFYKCKLTAASGVKAYLGRPWRQYAQTVFMECEMGDHIYPQGWHNWNKKEAEKTAFYAEYNNTGIGGNTASRVKWSKQLSAKEARKHTMYTYLAGNDNWSPIMINDTASICPVR
ncbi:MAG: pectinesterase family protein [Bacteroidales bacterium]